MEQEIPQRNDPVALWKRATVDGKKRFEYPRSHFYPHPDDVK